VVALPERDVRRYLAFAHETARVARAEPRRFYRWVIEGINALVPSDGVTHFESTRGAGGRFDASLVRVTALSPKYEQFRNRRELIAMWNGRLAYEHPVSAYRLQRPLDLRPLRLSDLTTELRYKRLEVYDALTRPFGFGWTASVGYRGPRGLSEIMCARRRPDFNERELLLLSLAATAVELAARDPAPHIQPARGLTKREVEVIERVARGCSNREIADALSLAPGTVKKHLDNIFAKLGVRNRLEATRAWLAATHDPPSR
jgi:DNA-binding CsgD family transcriptional regulator